MLSNWVGEAIRNSGIKQAELARRLTGELGRSIDRAAVNKMVRGGRKVAADELVAIEKVTGYRAPSELIEETGTVPVAGYVGAGAVYVPFETASEIDRVPAPESANDNTVAAIIRGESLGALFDSWLVFYDRVHGRPTSQVLGKLCVVGLADKRVMVKKIMRGQVEGLFNLISNFDPPIYDVAVEWCAVVKNMCPR